MTDQARAEIDSLLRRIHARIHDLEERLRTIEASAEREIAVAFEEANPSNTEPV